MIANLQKLTSNGLFIERHYRDIQGLHTYFVYEEEHKTLSDDFNWYAVRAAMADNCIKTYSDAGSVGIISDGCFFLVSNSHGDGLTRVGVVNELHENLKDKMNYYGTWRDFQVSDYDCDICPVNLNIEKGCDYDCYSREGLVIFVKAKEGGKKLSIHNEVFCHELAVLNRNKKELVKASERLNLLLSDLNIDLAVPDVMLCTSREKLELHKMYCDIDDALFEKFGDKYEKIFF